MYIKILFNYNYAFVYLAPTLITHLPAVHPYLIQIIVTCPDLQYVNTLLQHVCTTICRRYLIGGDLNIYYLYVLTVYRYYNGDLFIIQW